MSANQMMGSDLGMSANQMMGSDLGMSANQMMGSDLGMSAKKRKGSGLGMGEGPKRAKKAGPRVERAKVFEAGDLVGIKEEWGRSGMVVVRVLGKVQCRELVREQWERIWKEQPFLEPIDEAVLTEGGKRDLVDVLMGDGLSKAAKDELMAKSPLHRGFGASSEDVVFNLPGVWEVRQDPRIYEIARELSGEAELWVDLNRSIQKLPGEGSDEFLHWDMNPFRDECGERGIGVSGKVCYTKSSFVCVLGSHTETF